jgi:6-phosphogluconolactonase
MLKLLAIIFLILAVGCSSSRDMVYGNSGDFVTVAEWKDNKLTEIQKVAGAMIPGAIGYSPKHQTIYTSTGQYPKDGSPNGRIFSIQKDGTLKLKQKFSFPHGYAYFAIDKTNQFLIGASYSSGYNDIFRLDKEGIPQITDTVYEGKNTAHAVLLSPDNKYVYIPYVKQHNSLHQYSFDTKTGELKALNPAKAKVHPVSGPRHLAQHPTLPIVYSSNEQGVGVSVYKMNDNGTLDFKQICPANDTVPGKGKSASSLVVSTDGKYVFSAQRGRDPKENFIHTYKVLADGTLKPFGKTHCDHVPWIIQLSSNGKYLLVSATSQGTLTAYKILEGGKLTKKSKIDWGKNFRDMLVIGQ